MDKIHKHVDSNIHVCSALLLYKNERDSEEKYLGHGMNFHIQNLKDGEKCMLEIRFQFSVWLLVKYRFRGLTYHKQ